jgi:hypothetical protein
MANIGIIAMDDDLSSTLKLHPAEMANVRRCARRSAGIAFSGRQNFGHIAPPIEPAATGTSGNSSPQGNRNFFFWLSPSSPQRINNGIVAFAS